MLFCSIRVHGANVRPAEGAHCKKSKTPKKITKFLQIGHVSVKTFSWAHLTRPTENVLKIVSSFLRWPLPGAKRPTATRAIRKDQRFDGLWVGVANLVTKPVFQSQKRALLLENLQERSIRCLPTCRRLSSKLELPTYFLLSSLLLCVHKFPRVCIVCASTVIRWFISLWLVSWFITLPVCSIGSSLGHQLLRQSSYGAQDSWWIAHMILKNLCTCDWSIRKRASFWISNATSLRSIRWSSPPWSF